MRHFNVGRAWRIRHAAKLDRRALSTVRTQRLAFYLWVSDESYENGMQLRNRRSLQS